MSMEVQNKQFTAFIDQFTTNTYVMIIISNPHIQSAATNLNIQVARPHFEKFVQQNVRERETHSAQAGESAHRCLSRADATDEWVWEAAQSLLAHFIASVVVVLIVAQMY